MQLVSSENLPQRGGSGQWRRGGGRKYAPFFLATHGKALLLEAIPRLVLMVEGALHFYSGWRTSPVVAPENKVRLHDTHCPRMANTHVCGFLSMNVVPWQYYALIQCDCIQLPGLAAALPSLASTVAGRSRSDETFVSQATYRADAACWQVLKTWLGGECRAATVKEESPVSLRHGLQFRIPLALASGLRRIGDLKHFYPKTKCKFAGR